MGQVLIGEALQLVLTNVTQSTSLCRTMACFHVISISLISIGDHPCVDYLHYVYVPWLIMTSLWDMTLLGMPYCGTTMGNDIARDILCDITMDKDVAICTYIMAPQCIMTLLGTVFAMYLRRRYLGQWHCLGYSKEVAFTALKNG